MPLHDEEASFYLPRIEIFLSPTDQPGKFDFCREVAEAFLCGVAAVLLFSILDRADAPARTPGPALLPISHGAFFSQSTFRVTHVP